VSEIELKLNNFRTRIYPLRITIDGKEVFKGTTTRNLGYSTISFPPQTGKMVRIELTERVGQKAVAGEEMNGKKLDDGINIGDTDAAGRLSIIEVEIYEEAGHR
jgi:hypothetical protein